MDSNPSVGSGLQPLAWSSTTPSQVDTGNGVAVGPLVVKDPNGGGTGLAIWVEQIDLDPFDSPVPNPVYRLYARSFSGVTFATSDSGCPLGNPDITGNDGICVIDTGSVEFGAWAPQVSMDDNGDAIVLWAQTDCLANPTGGSCSGYAGGDRWVSNIYARRFSGPAGSKSWGTEEPIDTGDTSAFHPSLAIQPNGGGTAMAVWEQWDGTTWRIYARQFSGGSWATPCPGAGCPIIDSGVGPAHKPKVRMTDTGDALAVFIQFANATCYTAPLGRTTPVSSFSCPHNRLFYRTFTGGAWATPCPGAGCPDITPPTSLPALFGCFDTLASSGSENLDCDCFCGAIDECGCDCNTNETVISNDNTCRAFSDCRLAMDRSALASATVVYKSMEWALVPDPTVGTGIITNCTGDNNNDCELVTVTVVSSPSGCECDCNCTTGGDCDCSCDCDGSPASGTDTYQQIRIEAWRNTGSAGTTNNLANFSYLGEAGSTNCASVNPSDGDDNRAILNCDLDSPTVAIVPDGAPAERIALYERYDGTSDQIYYNWFSTGAWGPSTFLAGSAADPAMAPQIVMDDTGDALAVWVENASGRWRIHSSSFSGGIWGAAGIIDGNVGSEDHYFNPVVAMDGPGSALSLFIGWTQGFGMSLYGVTGP